MNSKKQTAKTAGFLYLLLVITGIFSIMYIPSRIIVYGDADATVNNIKSSDFLFRLGIACNLLSQVIYLFLVLVLYHLLKEVNKKYASLMVSLVVVGVAVAFVNTINQIAPLVILSGTDFLKEFNTAQLNALVMIFLDLHGQGTMMVEIFWGLWLIPFGILVIRSGFLPKILGYFLIVGGFCYVIESLFFILSPGFGGTVFQYITIPADIGELGIMLWLLVKGIKEPPIIKTEAVAGQY